MKLTVRIKQSEAAPKRAFFSQVLPKKQFDYLILMNNSTGDIEKWSKRLVLLLLFFFFILFTPKCVAWLANDACRLFIYFFGVLVKVKPNYYDLLPISI